MSDIDLYSNETDTYNQLQNCRPDYRNAVAKIVEYTKKYLQPEATVVDFCSGTGSVTKKISEEVMRLHKVILVDINQQFMDIARQSKINTDELVLKTSNILEVEFEHEAEMVLSIFAYHHVQDTNKTHYIEQIKKALKPGGTLLLAEIYSPNKETTISYYEKLLVSIPKKLQTSELKRFLKETAESENFEFKVAKSFADRQLKDAQFTLIESSKIWPDDDTPIGTFVEVWRHAAR